MRTLKSLAYLTVVASTLLAVHSAGAIENERGKTYKLTEKHGPWMIMVASFRNIREEDRKTEGLSAEDAASELVFELRDKGIPAYTYSQDGKVEKIATQDRLGRDDTRIFAAQRDMICVLAGNYATIDDSVAQKTLNYVKKLHPKFLKNTKNGAVVRASGGQKGPLVGAFLTINPLRSPGDVASRRVDDETKFLNSGIDHALVGCKKQYTVKIATFAGKSAVPMQNSRFTRNEGLFEKELQKSTTNIVRAGEDAAQLTRALRQKGYIAYVYHDKFQSYVTMGGFDSKTDPVIQEIFKAFGAKMKVDPNSKNRTESLAAEVLTLPGATPGKPAQTWIFDPVPEIIEVPHIR